SRRIWPTVATVGADGAHFVAPDEVAAIVETVVQGRVGNPGGAP
ncbi:MAG: proteasome subunit beta, partial [Intrasporangiaceae bacterium]|nr:proteasome subunit beta [Intrasporangiaceae bacterium]